MSYYDGDSWANHVLNEVKCAECEEYFDDQEGEGNICPPCVEKGESKMGKDPKCNTCLDGTIKAHINGQDRIIECPDCWLEEEEN